MCVIINMNIQTAAVRGDSECVSNGAKFVILYINIYRRVDFAAVAAIVSMYLMGHVCDFYMKKYRRASFAAVSGNSECV